MPHLFAASTVVLLLGFMVTSNGCATSALSALVGVSESKDPLADARVLFQRHCRSCHGPVAAGDGPYARAFRTPAPDLRPIVAAADDRDPIVQRILAGPSGARRTENAMPAFGDVLSGREGHAILALIGSFADESESDASNGPRLFRNHCATCHGVLGMGDGPLAGELVPRPRDLTKSWYRFRSTASGVGPRHADLVATIERGLGTTGMGAYRALGRDAVNAVASYLATLTTVVPDAGRGTRADAASGRNEEPSRGRQLYEDARCWQCHGTEGRGDGPSAGMLRDDAGRASLPANLTKPWRLKGGADIDSLVRTIANGMNGTPMPSYGEVFSVNELWAVARYVRGLAEVRAEVPVRLPVFASGVGSLRDPMAPFWREAQPTGVPLGPQVFVEPRWHRPAIDAVQMVIALSDKEIAFHLAWDDRFENRTMEDDVVSAVDDPRQPGKWRVRDQLAIQLIRVSEDGVLPPLSGGGPTTPVTRWVWSAGAEAPRLVESWGLSDERSRRGTDGLTATAVFDEGRWRLVLARTRDDAETRRLLPPGAHMALSLLIWEGSQGEQGSRHSLSSWIPFTLPEY